MKNRIAHLTIAAVAATAMGLLRPSLARAGGTALEAEQRYERSRRLGTAGMIVGYSGPPLMVLGGLRLSPLYLLTGTAMNTIGPSLLASSAVMGVSAVRTSGGQVSAGLAGVSVAGAGAQLVSHGRWSADRLGVMEAYQWAGFVGWTTGMLSGTVQHALNRRAWRAREVSQAPLEPKRFTVTLAPTSTGARVVGTF